PAPDREAAPEIGEELDRTGVPMRKQRYVACATARLQRARRLEKVRAVLLRADRAGLLVLVAAASSDVDVRIAIASLRQEPLHMSCLLGHAQAFQKLQKRRSHLREGARLALSRREPRPEIDRFLP